jgi:holo-[acyl-carrier protein] synthase
MSRLHDEGRQKIALIRSAASRHARSRPLSRAAIRFAADCCRPPTSQNDCKLIELDTDAEKNCMPTRVGIDLIAVESVSEALRSHRKRYLERVYTEREIADCRNADGVDAQRLAARFAAKEATMKVLRPDREAVPWRSIGIRREPPGWVSLELSGAAARLASRSGIVDFDVSLTHHGDYAAAAVVATLEGRDE